MKKRVLSVLLATVMVAGVFAGCGGSKDTAKTSDTAAEDTADDADAADTSSETTKFVVGFDAEYPPYGYMDENG